MGKRSIRTLHFEMVARVIKTNADRFRSDGVDVVERIALDFADEFEIRAGVTFDRKRFLTSCGMEGE